MKSEKPSNHRQKFAFGALVTIFVGWFALFAISGFAQRTRTTAVMSNSSITNSKPESTSVVRGRVIYEDTGRAVRRTSISLMSLKGSGVAKSAITDDNGAFEVRKVPAGEYLISVSSPGVISPLAYANFDKDVEMGEGSANLAEMIRFADKVTVDGISDADVFVRAKHGAAINGRVYYADGDPAIGVKIEVLRKKDDKFSGVVTGFNAFTGPFGGSSFGDKTDDRGIYRISGLPPGEYVVRVSESANHKVNDDESRFGEMMLLGLTSGSFLNTYHPNVLDVKEAKILTLELGQEAGETNITLPARNFYKITGRIIARGTKQPVKDALISISRDDETSSFNNLIQKELQRVKTDETGNWSYKELPAGKYTINVKQEETYDYEYDSDLGGTMSNSSTAAKKPKPPKPPKFASKKIELTILDKDLNDVEIDLTFGGQISGILKSDGYTQTNSVKVDAETEDGENLSGDFVNAGDKLDATSRKFNLDGLPNGKIYLDANMYDYSTGFNETSTNYVKSIIIDNKDYIGEGIEITDGTNIKNAVITIGTDGGKLKGKIRRKDNPAANARFILIPTDSGKVKVKKYRRYVTANENGEFETGGAPFEYYVILLSDEDANFSIKEEKLKERMSGAEKITIKPKETTTLNLTLP